MKISMTDLSLHSKIPALEVTTEEQKTKHYL